MLVNESIIQFFNSKYVTVGGDYKEFMRLGKAQEDGEVIVELRFRKVYLLAFPNKNKFKRNEPWVFYIPKSDTVKDLETKIKRLLSYYYYMVRKDKTIQFTKFRLWKCLIDDLE